MSPYGLSALPCQWLAHWLRACRVRLQNSGGGAPKRKRHALESRRCRCRLPSKGAVQKRKRPMGRLLASQHELTFGIVTNLKDAHPHPVMAFLKTLYIILKLTDRHVKI